MDQGATTIYVIEDNDEVARLVKDAFERQGYRARTFDRAQTAVRAIERRRPALCVVDLGLPDADGLQLVGELRRGFDFGIIVLTARGDPADRIVGLELGADDYLAKPFEPRELVARARSVLRRLEQPHSGRRIASFAGWRFDTEALRLHAPDGRELRLSAAEARLLRRFVDSPQRVLSRDQLLAAEGSRTYVPYDRSIDVRISRLRQKIEVDPQHPQILQTVYGAGYLFTKAVAWQGE
jgi:DNA-binding response OmpR family regulator